MNRFQSRIFTMICGFMSVGNAQANSQDLTQLKGLSEAREERSYPAASPEAETREAALRRLEAAAIEAAAAVHVPYVWGGNRIGSVEDCLSCNQCLSQKPVGPKRRVGKCPSCTRCGIDCSHLINQIFAAAGLEFTYASSGTLGRASSQILFQDYQLIDVGRDYSLALPGDIMVYRRHVGLLMANHGGMRGDLIHASRFAPKGRPRTGGIRYDIDKNIVRARGGLIRILRHQKLGLPGRVPNS